MSMMADRQKAKAPGMRGARFPAICACLLALCLLCPFLSGCDMFTSAQQLERQVLQILEIPVSHSPRPDDSEHAATLRRYLDKAVESSRRFDAYERLTILSLNNLEYDKVSGLLDEMYKEFIAVPHVDLAAVYRACEFYLRYHPEGQQRYAAWNKLVSLTLRGDKNLAVQMLEAMSEEFSDYSVRLQDILLRQVELEEELRRFPDAVESWERLLALPGISAAHIVEWSSRLGRVFFLQRDFASAEEVLLSCAERTLPAATGVSCLLDLGTLYQAQNRLDDMRTVMQRILAIADISEDLRARAIFELADIEYQSGNLEEARGLFTSIRASYPNPMVIDMRLRAIRDKMGS